MAVPGYDSGHMRAVSVSIIRARIAWNEALAIDDARSTSARLLQVVMIKDAAVDHRYADSRAIQSVLLAGNVIHHRCNIGVRCDFVPPVRTHISDVRMVLQPLQHFDWNAIGRAIDVLQRKFQPSTARRHHFKVPRLGCLVELDNHAYGSISVYRKGGEIVRKLFVPTTGVRRRWNQRKHHSNRE